MQENVLYYNQCQNSIFSWISQNLDFVLGGNSPALLRMSRVKITPPKRSWRKKYDKNQFIENCGFSLKLRLQINLEFFFYRNIDFVLGPPPPSPRTWTRWTVGTTSARLKKNSIQKRFVYATRCEIFTKFAVSVSYVGLFWLSDSIFDELIFKLIRTLPLSPTRSNAPRTRPMTRLWAATRAPYEIWILS